MINFDAVYFSERCSEEVLSFFDAQCIYITPQKVWKSEFDRLFLLFLVILDACLIPSERLFNIL